MLFDPLNTPLKSSILYALTREGYLSARALERALTLAEIIPSKHRWQTFLSTLLFALGVVFLLAGVIFFFAYNWAQMGHFIKLGLLQAAIAATVAISWHKGLEHLSGKFTLWAASVLVGPLLAVYGQTYQTGADPYELFFGWAILIIGWVAISRFAPLWLFFLILLNISLILYWTQILDMTRWTFAGMCETCFLLNAGALIAWEWLAAPKIPWLSGRWIPRLLVCASTAFLTIPTISCIFDCAAEPFLLLASILYFSFIAACLWFYQRGIHDLFMLAAGLFSLIIIITAFFIKMLGEGFIFLMFYSFLIIVQTAAVVFWLRKVEKTWRDAA